MATKKIPTRKPVAKKPAPKKAATKKVASAADFRKKEELGKAKAKANSRRDFAGTSGFGDTSSSFLRRTKGGVGDPFYQSKADKSAVGYLKSKGINPNKKVQGQKVKDMQVASNYNKASRNFLGFENDFRGKTQKNGIPQLWKNSVSKDSYKQLTKVVRAAETKKKKK